MILPKRSWKHKYYFFNSQYFSSFCQAICNFFI